MMGVSEDWGELKIVRQYTLNQFQKDQAEVVVSKVKVLFWFDFVTQLLTPMTHFQTHPDNNKTRKTGLKLRPIGCQQPSVDDGQLQ